MGLENKNQGAGQFNTWLGLYYWFADSVPLATPSHDGERELSGLSSYKDTNFIGVSFNLNYLLSPYTVTLKVRASKYEFWGDKIQPIPSSFYIEGIKTLLPIHPAKHN